jgi:hypothetical protein
MCGTVLGFRWHRHRALAGFAAESGCVGREAPSPRNLRDRNPTAADLGLPEGLTPTEFSEAVPPAFTRAIGRALAGPDLDPVPYVEPKPARDRRALTPYPRPSPTALGPDTDLLIDGHPRSANTFMVRAFALSNPEVRLAHHHHHAMTFEVAAAHGIPAVALIREPLGSAASWAAYAPRVSIERALESWIGFYSMLPDQVPLADFADVIRDPARVMGAIAERFCFDLRPGPTPAAVLDGLRPQAAPSRSSAAHRDKVAAQAPAALVERARDLYRALTSERDLLSFAVNGRGSPRG